MIGDYVAFVVAETYFQAVDAARTDRGRLRAAAGRRSRPATRSIPACRWFGRIARTISASSRSKETRRRPTPPSRAPRMWSSIRFVINRVTAATMEPRGCIGLYEPTEGRYTIYTTLQRTNVFQTELSQYVLKVPDNKIRVVCGDIGGSFGMKSAVYNEVALVLLGAKLDRPAGEMGGDAFGIFPVRRAGARQRHRGRAGARQGRHFPRLPRQDHRRHRRLSAGRHAGLHRQSRHAGRRLSHAGLAYRRHRRVHPHPAGAALSRQRPPRSRLCHRAHGRSRRRPARHRSGRLAPAQHHSVERHAVQDQRHLHLRLRRVRKESGHGA